MNDIFSLLLIGVAVVGAASAAVLVIRNRRINDGLLYWLTGLEAALLAQMVGGFIALARTGRDVDGLTFVSYLITTVLILPAAVLWSIAEKSRWGTAVLIAGCLVVAVLILRLDQIWTGSRA